MDPLIYLQEQYKLRIMKILNNENISIIEREFYSESQNWYTNQDVKSMVDTLIWLSMSDTEKKEKLDLEIDNFFDDSEKS